MHPRCSFHHFICFLCILFLPFAAFSKTGAGFVGQVIDGESGLALPYANVLVFAAGTEEQLAGTTTSEDGSFVLLNVGFGTFDLRIRALGFEEKTLKNVVLDEKTSRRDLGVLVLQTSAVKLESVTYEAKSEEMTLSPDRKVYRIDQDAANAGGTAIQILETIPSVSVDAEGTVSLRGNQNVQILVNGRKSSQFGNDIQAALQQLPGDMIERVEVITNPSAKYDAEGVAGMINIVMKKERKVGVNGSVNAYASAPLGYGGSTTLNYRFKKFNFFVGEGYRNSQRPFEIDLFQNYFTPTPYSSLVEHQETDREAWSNNVNGGFDYSITDRTSLCTTIYHYYRNSENSGDIRYNFFDDRNGLMALITRNEPQDEIARWYGSDVNFTHDFEQQGHRLTADFQIAAGNSNETSITEEQIHTDNTPSGTLNNCQDDVNNKEEDIILLAKADYVLPLSETMKVEAGVQSEHRSLDNSYTVHAYEAATPTVLIDNEMNFQRSVHAAYGTFSNKRRKFSYQLGIRGEYSDVQSKMIKSDEENDHRYFDLFPSAHVNYSLTQFNTLTTSYTRRISRPGHYFLRPFNSYTDSRNMRRGNPNLKPEYIDSFELGQVTMWRSGSLSTSLYYSYSDNTIRFLQTREDGIIYNTPYNLAERKAVGLEVVASQKVAKWWQLQGNINLFNENVSGTLESAPIENKATSYFGSINSRFTIMNATNLQLRYYYRGPYKKMQGKQKPISIVFASLSHQFMEGNLLLAFNVRDLFDNRERILEINAPTFYSRSEMRWSARSYHVSLTYRFNQDKQQRPRRRRTTLQNAFEEGEG